MQICIILTNKYTKCPFIAKKYNLRLSLKSSMRIISFIRCSGLRFSTLYTHSIHVNKHTYSRAKVIIHCFNNLISWSHRACTYIYNLTIMCGKFVCLSLMSVCLSYPSSVFCAARSVVAIHDSWPRCLSLWALGTCVPTLPPSLPTGSPICRVTEWTHPNGKNFASSSNNNNNKWICTAPVCRLTSEL